MALSASDRDPSADPGVDFYRFANGGWLDANPIPAGYGSWGAFEEVGRRNELALRELLERAAETPGDLLGDAFAAGLDLDAIEAAGLEPIAPLLQEIEGAQDQWAVLALLPKLHRAGIFALFGWGVTVDHDDSDRYLLWLVQAGLGLADRERYFDPSDAAVELRAAYVEHVGAQLAHVGFGAERAGSVLEFETRLAGLHLKGEERRDVERTHNRYTRSELAMLAPELSLASHLSALGAGAAASVNVENTRLFEELEEVVGDDRARHAARVPRVHRRADARQRAAQAHRRRGLRVLRPADQGPAPSSTSAPSASSTRSARTWARRSRSATSRTTSRRRPRSARPRWWRRSSRRCAPRSARASG